MGETTQHNEGLMVCTFIVQLAPNWTLDNKFSETGLRIFIRVHHIKEFKTLLKLHKEIINSNHSSVGPDDITHWRVGKRMYYKHLVQKHIKN